MKKALLTVLFSVVPLCVLGHPGKTDRYGGHECLQKCEEWNLYYKEYHLHDKDGRPIHVARRPKGSKAGAPVSTPVETAIPISEPLVTVQTVTVYQTVPATASESWPPVSFLWILCVLFLLLLLIRLTRKRE